MQMLLYKKIVFVFRTLHFYFPDCKRKANLNPFGLCCLMVKVILENHQQHNSVKGNSSYKPANNICCCYDVWKLFTN